MTSNFKTVERRVILNTTIVNGEVKPIPFCDTRYFAPAGGLYTTANEMAKWLQFQIDKGKVGSRQVVSEESMQWIHRPHMVAEPIAYFYGGGLVTYGQGWFQHNLSVALRSACRWW